MSSAETRTRFQALLKVCSDCDDIATFRKVYTQYIRKCNKYHPERAVYTVYNKYYAARGRYTLLTTNNVPQEGGIHCTRNKDYPARGRYTLRAPKPMTEEGGITLRATNIIPQEGGIHCAYNMYNIILSRGAGDALSFLFLANRDNILSMVASQIGKTFILMCEKVV